jgi:hypothetical protein
MCGHPSSEPYPFRIVDDLVDLFRLVAEVFQRQRHTLVDNLEISAAGQFLELHQGKIGLNTGGVAIHHQADGSGRRNYGNLRISVTVLLAHSTAFVGIVPGCLQQVLRAEFASIPRFDGQPFILFIFTL